MVPPAKIWSKSFLLVSQCRAWKHFSLPDICALWCICELLSLIATWEKLYKGLDYLPFFFMLLKKFLQRVFGEKMEHFLMISLTTENSWGVDPSPVYIDYPAATWAEGRAWPVLNIISVDLYGLLQCNDCWFWALIACVWQNQKGSEVYYCFDTVSKGKLFISILIQPFVNTQQRKMLSPIPLLVEILSFLWL